MYKSAKYLPRTATFRFFDSLPMEFSAVHLTLTLQWLHGIVTFIVLLLPNQDQTGSLAGNIKKKKEFENFFMEIS